MPLLPQLYNSSPDVCEEFWASVNKMHGDLHQSMLPEADDDDGFVNVHVPEDRKDCPILLSGFHTLGRLPDDIMEQLHREADICTLSP